MATRCDAQSCGVLASRAGDLRLRFRLGYEEAPQFEAGEGLTRAILADLERLAG